MQLDPTPPHIAALLGKRVRVRSPNDSSQWEGRLVSYAPDPSVIIDRGILGSRICLPASYPITEIDEPAPQTCPACRGSGIAFKLPEPKITDPPPAPLKRGSNCPVHGGTLLYDGDNSLMCLEGHGYRLPEPPPAAKPSRRSTRRFRGA